MRWSLVVGAVLAGLAVLAGAFGAHALETAVTPERLEVFNTAARYQMYHALALLLVGLLAPRWPGTPVRRVALLFTVGTVVFSGSLYVLVLADLPLLGAVTPLGGLCFISGWLLLAWCAWRGEHGT